jgi:nucleoside phosphorylase/CheY-like chemotaxis protein
MGLLRILIVEDSTPKLGAIVKVLTSVPGIDLGDISEARDALEAKKLMKQQRFDLLLLDVFLPSRIDRPPTAEAGIELLREITERDTYIRPHHIIGITAFTEGLEAARKDFLDNMWAIVLYDQTAEEWQQNLQRKVHYLLEQKKVARFTDGISFDCDLVILTALDTVELNAVRSLPGAWATLEVPHDATAYLKGSFKEGNKSVSVIAASAPRMGMAASAALAAKMIHNFRPKYVAMVGILAGIREEANYGDILVADPSWDWGSGKFETKENGQRRFLPAPHQLPLDVELREKIKRFSTRYDVLAKIRGEWRGKAPDHALQLRVGPVASGAAVLSAVEAVTEIREQQHRKILGIEMEAYGVMTAGEYASGPRPKIFCAKSVCDFADEHKSDDYQAYAAYTSAAFVYRFVLDELAEQ